MMEATGIITNTRFQIESALKERKAFDEKNAADLAVVNLNMTAILDVMEKGGLIGKTIEGKVFMTQKGQENQIRGFKISNNFPEKKFIRFSRNK
jgi:hypothetical protein